MSRRNSINKSDSDYINHINYNRDLSPFDKKLESAKIIDQTGSVDIDSAWQRILDRITGKSKIIDIFNTLTRVAAVLTIPLLAFTLWSLFFQQEKSLHTELTQNEIIWQVIESPVGMRSHVVLPDGTNLWLNAGSSMSYSIPFIREKRELKLSGEAYLEVAKNEKSPFVVQTDNGQVEVLGTQFNVSAYPESNKLNIALKEGNVRFLFDGNGGIRKYAEMKPNDLLEFDKKAKTVARENTDIEKYISWHQNVMILDDTPMTEVARLIEQWYGVEVVIANEAIKRYKFTTTFDNEPLHRVLELLELSSPGIKIRYTMGKPIPGAKKFSPSIVTFTKN